MSPCDVKTLVRWAVISLLAGLLITGVALYYSDRMTQSTAKEIQADLHDIHQDIHNLSKCLKCEEVRP